MGIYSSLPAHALAQLVHAGNVDAAGDAVLALAGNVFAGDDRQVVIDALSDVLVDAPAPPRTEAVAYVATSTGERKPSGKAPRPLRNIWTKPLCERALSGDRDAALEVKARWKHKGTLQPQNRKAIAAARAELKAAGMWPKADKVRKLPDGRKVVVKATPAPEPTEPKVVKHRSAAAAYSARVMALSAENATVRTKVRASTMAQDSGWTLDEVQALTDEEVMEFFEAFA